MMKNARKTLGAVVLLACFYNGQAFADSAPTNTVAPGNQGYIYGTPPAPDTTTTDSSAPQGTEHPIRDIIHAIEKLDCWFQENFW